MDKGIPKCYTLLIWVRSVELYGDGATFKFDFFSIFGRFLAFLAGAENFKVTFLLG